MRMEMSQEYFYTLFYKGNAAPIRAPRTGSHKNNFKSQTLCEQRRFNIAQEPFCARIYRKKAGSQIQHPDQAPAFTLTVKTPQCGDTAWGTLKETSNKYF
jgi:hypothetical protein